MLKTLRFNALLAFMCIPALLTAQPVIMMDAGSSGTRIHGYKVDATQHTLAPTFTVKIKPGIATFIQGEKGQQSIDIEGLDSYLDNLVNTAKQQGLTDMNAPTYVYATAGMRLQDTAIQHQLMQAIKDHLRSKGLSQAQSTVISGQHEALYDWLSVNQKALLENEGNTTGIVDVGGASAEIAFALKHPAPDLGKMKDLMPVTINGKTYNVLAKSYLGLGKDQALAKIAARSPQSHAFCYPNGLWLDNSAHFRWLPCRTRVKKVFSGYQKLAISKKRYEHSVPKQFVATSALYYTEQFLNAPFPKWPKQTKILCKQDWKILKAQYPNIPEQYLKDNCMAAVYGQSMLTNLLGLRHKAIVFGSSDWTLGAAMAYMEGFEMPE